MKEKSLAVIACDGKDTMSVRVPDGFLGLHRSFKIHYVIPEIHQVHGQT